MAKRKALMVPVVVVAVLVLAFVVVIVWTRGGTPVAKQEAVADFRRTTISLDADQDLEPADPGAEAEIRLPDVGVYAYASKGDQEVKFGPLPADPRILPDEIVARVAHVGVPDGSDPASISPVVEDEAAQCFEFELKVFAEHEESMTTCVGRSDDDGAEGTRATIAVHLIRMKMGPVTATAHLECEELLVMARGSSQQGIPCVLRLTGAPVEVRADLVGSVSAGEPETIEVGGDRVGAVPVRLSYDADSKVTGAWSETVWMSEDTWLPLRFDRDIGLIGPATIIENSELHLGSLHPET